VVLGVEPIPLIHGDKVEIGGHELFYSDETKAGDTEPLAAKAVPDFPQPSDEQDRATAPTGGRLVSLAFGTEYRIPASGLKIGRDASADVVVAQSDVSRIHAEIAPVANGYEVRDLSTNGMLVNGALVKTSQLLGRGDVIRIGGEEFRFYADPVVATPAPAPVVEKPKPPRDRPEPITVAPRRVTLAVLEVARGGHRGPTHELTTPIVHVGRGPHNDIVLDDKSVSDAHAKLQLRNDGWYVVDLGSTNGTHVNGVWIETDRKLHGTPVIRFGSVTAIFRPRDVLAEVRKGAQVIAGAERPQLNNTIATSMPAVPNPLSTPVPSSVPEPPASRPWVWIIAILALSAAAAFFVLNR
jgi:pSer/pThr/pTyr-binding forkhead associated (FHA) protein